MNGGYLNVSLKNYDFSNGDSLYVKDLYKTIANSNYKAVMLCDIIFDGEHKQNVYSAVERRANSIIVYAYGNTITITDTDRIVVVQSDNTSGGLPVVEFTTAIIDTSTHNLSAEENAALDSAASKGVPIVAKINILGANIGIVLMFQGADGNYSYGINTSIFSLSVATDGDGWYAFITTEEG